MASKRISKELKGIRKDPPDFCRLGPENDQDMFIWKAIMRGPPGSPYEGGKFELSIHFPPNYPFNPPKVAFGTKIFHPNIGRNDGSIHIDILKDNWTPALTIPKVLQSIYSILRDPLLDKTVEENIANMYKTDRSQYEKDAQNWTQMYAMYLLMEQSRRSLKVSRTLLAITAQVLLMKITCFIGKQKSWIFKAVHMLVECFTLTFISLSNIHLNHPRKKIFHPNIDGNGSIGLDILQDRWNPNLTISKVLLKICSLLKNPNPDVPLVPEIACMYNTDREKYVTTAQRWTEKYNMD
ncbi:hypothetical protein ES319_D12G259600v1 [Gossypium barbadense]|uniref:E2 ubiquitin-conjugating enzyme n=2 Tax=Gossypium TaxID=3633 RepID=A0A5J5P3E8_GOSBA|nr:hypothetical protein ES319_D12G259600v1 [Gossypium barbadense]TYG42662.1 hypothetical protein ES288_D12G275100v1 [Gossypium darwinii]